MMKRNIKRILSLALVLCLVLGLTINVYATVDADDTEAVAVEPAEETADDAAAAEDAEAAEADSEDTEGTEAAVEEIAEETTEADVENEISLASEDGIATVDDEGSGENAASSSDTISVTVYTSDSTKKTFTSISGDLATSSTTSLGSIATYVVTLLTSSGYTLYDSYTVDSTAATSITSGNSYAIGNGTYYLAVNAYGVLSLATTVDEYSTWTVASSGSGYTIYNAATGYYLSVATSSEQNASAGSVSLDVSTTGSIFSWNSSGYFYYAYSSNSATTNYRLCVDSSGASLSTSSNASVYAVTTGTSQGTYYTYTITFTGTSTEGSATLTLASDAVFDVTVQKENTFTTNVITTDSNGNETTKSVELTQSYGWHIANIETLEGYTFAVAASQQALEDQFEYEDGKLSAQYTSGGGFNSTGTVISCGDISGYDADVYYSDNSYSTLNVTVYGSNDKGDGENGTELSMTESEGTKEVTMPDGNSGVGGVYDDSTIYDYDYITIVPAVGYYVSNVVIACNASIEAMSGSPYAELSAVTSFTNECGVKDYLGVYGVGCFQMSSSNLTTASYSPTEGTSVELDMASWIASHAEDTGVGDPYFILIELAEIPTPLYVEYEAGDGDSYITSDCIVDNTDCYATSTASENDGESTQKSVAFAYSSSELENMEYLYDVLAPSVTSYVKNDVTYYFTGWAVTYYTTASTNATETYLSAVDGSDEEYIVDAETNGVASYPYLDGTVTLASDSIDYGSGTTLYLFTHVKLVAQWTSDKAEADYVVDFGLPMELDLIDTLDTNLSSGYDWTVTAIATQPSYGTATVTTETDGDGNISSDVTYTLTDVMEGTDTMLVWLTGTPKSNDTNALDTYSVVEVTIYPATTVYYEEGFATYGTTWSVSEGGTWSGNMTVNYTDIQQTHVANNASNGSYYNYGYDSVYASDESGSNNTNAVSTKNADSLSFSFTGTGVDIYATGTETTGTVIIRIVKNTTTTDEETGETTTTSTSVKMLNADTKNIGTYTSTTSYNTPIASVTGLDYGNYTVTMYVSTPRDSGVIFDGFRVYDTIDNDAGEGSEEANTVQTTVYRTDSEDYPVYTEIRDVVLTGLLGTSDATEYTEDYVSSMSIGDAQVYASEDTGVAVYSTDSTYTCEKLLTLMDDGTKNELYLPAGVTLVLKLDKNALDTEDSNSSPRTIQVGVKSTSGTSSVRLSSDTNASSVTVSSVDMFYTASVKTEDGVSYVTITNSGETTISLTKLKASDEVTISDEAITEEEITALLSSTEETGAEEETAVFEPESFTVSTSVKTSGKSATVTVTAKTSTDVESVTVNGVEVTSYKTVTERTGQGRNATVTTYRQFTYTETVTASGTYTYEVCAADADGTASAAAAATAAVSIRSTQTGQANQINQNKR